MNTSRKRGWRFILYGRYMDFQLRGGFVAFYSMLVDLTIEEGRYYTDFH